MGVNNLIVQIMKDIIIYKISHIPVKDSLLIFNYNKIVI